MFCFHDFFKAPVVSSRGLFTICQPSSIGLFWMFSAIRRLLARAVSTVLTHTHTHTLDEATFRASAIEILSPCRFYKCIYQDQISKFTAKIEIKPKYYTEEFS